MDFELSQEQQLLRDNVRRMMNDIATADYIREQITTCLDEIAKQTGVMTQEFHFVDIYNRKEPWNRLPEHMNLLLFEFFGIPLQFFSRIRTKGN